MFGAALCDAEFFAGDDEVGGVATAGPFLAAVERMVQCGCSFGGGFEKGDVGRTNSVQ